MYQDEEVLQVLAVAMSETVEAHTGPHTGLVKMLGEFLSVNMAAHLFLDLVRGREALLGMIGEIADKRTRRGQRYKPAQNLRAVICYCLDSKGGPKKSR